MSILTTTEIQEEIEKGRIIIEPFTNVQIGPASVDLTLSNAFRVFVRLPMHIKAIDDINYKCATKGIWIPDEEYITIHPGDTILGMTREKITLPEDICGWLEGRSKFARIGLLVHISASFMQSGISNHQVLEMSNFGPIPIDMYPGTSVCQFIFQRTKGRAIYTGQFRLQTPEIFCKD
ncbi:MAG TPA: dCTP deaminase [Candidatus Eremiobacteraeota bacterium]|nr:dCTP deaminase [Candidatus Eremiobacteraeota bacterium]